MSQKGEIQPIGSVNEKVEGFFDVCRLKGLTGTQGVLIPKANIPDLMLEPRVVQAVRDGRFHIYALETIDEGIEILTGVAAGSRAGRNRYPMGTVNGRVEARLRKMAGLMRDYGGHTGEVVRAGPDLQPARLEEQHRRGLRRACRRTIAR